MRFLTILMSTFFGLGFLPLMPGTFASFAVILVYYFVLREFPKYFPLLFIPLIFLIGIFFSSRAELIFKKKDPRPVVIDEVLGQMITLFLIKPGLASLIIGFSLFRIFDVLKPFPCFEVQKFKGGLGIMLDDLFAGIWANIFLRLTIFLFNL
ncbi:MAG: phosphatidylglycerophosphatase A family protein [Candidatus Aminicenantia bacterium]